MRCKWQILPLEARCYRGINVKVRLPTGSRKRERYGIRTLQRGEVYHGECRADRDCRQHTTEAGILHRR